ncbi:MAG: hypothetical protein LBE12_06555 [Planctomycetaceae bacterium]|nr:hypothetical protein [Planctomycetaceae bacterium]
MTNYNSLHFKIRFYKFGSIKTEFLCLLSKILSILLIPSKSVDPVSVDSAQKRKPNGQV